MFEGRPREMGQEMEGLSVVYGDEQVMIDATNQVGVDINLASSNERREESP